jgi:YVTN family beta-propeller protein
VRAQSVGATFGTVVPLGGTPSDIVLDESRGRLYLVSTAADRVYIYDYNEHVSTDSILVGDQPLAAAISMDGAYLYVTNNASSSLSVVDLSRNMVVQTVSLPARPEGVEVGDDGRVLITTQGTGTGNTQNTLLMFDRTQALSQQVLPIQFPPPPPTPPGQPGAFFTRPVPQFRGRLMRTPDGRFIAGLTVFGNGNSTYLFVYESASGTILKSRSVGGQSSVMAMSPDGSKIMAGYTMYDLATLAVVAQMNPANAPFPIQGGSFSSQANVGGSAFSPDGATLYAAFNTAPFSNPPTRPQASTLFITSAAHLGMKLGIKMPESIVSRMIVTSDGNHGFGLSESGLLYLPLSTLYEYPILQPEVTQVFLALDECNKGLARFPVRVNNLGQGKLTFSVPNTGAALVAQVESGVAPSEITFVMEPGRAGVNRQPGTNLFTGGATGTGAAINVNLASNEAINIPNTIRVFMNYRQPDQRGIVYPIPSGLSIDEGAWDIVLDEPQRKVYISNSGYNRVEVFDIARQRFVQPIEVGQMPHQMAMTPDGGTLYVANAGSESISIVDLELGKVVGAVEFPPIPRAGNAAVIFPQAMAYGWSGLQFIMSNGSQWKVVGNTAVPRPLNDGITPNTLPTPRYMISSPSGDRILTLGGTGIAYLYDSLIDNYTVSRQLFTAPINSYYGPLAVGEGSNFMLANGLILNSSLAVIGGAERPGVTQTGPGQPGQPPVVTVVSAGQRNIAAVATLDDSRFVRLTTPVRNNINAATRDDIRPTLEQVDTRTGSEMLVGVAPENPYRSVFGNQRANIPPRQMVVDSKGTAYIISVSGLTVMSLSSSGTSSRPQVAPRGVVNSTDGTFTITPGAFITIIGANLASEATAEDVPAPKLLGGSCVVFNDMPLSLIRTGPDQISAQVPENIRPGPNVMQVRSLATAQSSDPMLVVVQRP